MSAITIENISLANQDTRSATVEFNQRKPLTRGMDLAAVTIADSYQHHLGGSFDFGLGRPVLIHKGLDRLATASKRAPRHVIVTAVGTKDLILWLIEEPNLNWYLAVPLDGAEFESAVRALTGPQDVRQRPSANFDHLYCDLDGEYAGAQVNYASIKGVFGQGYVSPLQRPLYLNEALGATELDEASIIRLQDNLMLACLADPAINPKARARSDATAANAASAAD